MLLCAYSTKGKVHEVFTMQDNGHISMASHVKADLQNKLQKHDTRNFSSGK